MPLSIIINKSLQEGAFPQMMKTAYVIPLFKSKDKLSKENYRPISLLLTLSKLLEKVVYKHTYEFMEKTKQIYDGQFGFRSKHSCENAIQNLLGDILKSEDQGLITKVDITAPQKVTSNDTLSLETETVPSRSSLQEATLQSKEVNADITTSEEVTSNKTLSPITLHDLAISTDVSTPLTTQLPRQNDNMPIT